MAAIQIQNFPPKTNGKTLQSWFLLSFGGHQFSRSNPKATKRDRMVSSLHFNQKFWNKNLLTCSLGPQRMLT